MSLYHVSQLRAGGLVIPCFTFVLARVESGLCMRRVITATRSVMVMNTISILWAGTQ